MNFLKMFEVFRVGSSVADVVKAKKWSALGLTLSGALYQLAGVFPEFVAQLGLTGDMVKDGAAAIGTLVGLFAVFATSRTVGVLPAKHEADLHDTGLPK